MRGVVLAAVVGGALASAPALAEKVKTNQATKLRARGGEHATVVMSIKAGQSMTILNKEGRWLKVRLAGRTGYIPRSTVDLPDDDSVQRNTRRRPFVDGRSTHRGFGEGSPDDRVGADATGGDKGGDDEDDKPKHGSKPKHHDDDDDKPKSHKHDDDDDKPKDKDKDDDAGGGEETGDQRPTAHVTEATKIREQPKSGSDVSFKAKPSQTLYVEDTKGKWTEVSLEEGDIGWVETDKLEISGGDGGGPHKRMMDLRARVGVTLVSQGLRTTGGSNTVPDNYNIGSSAATFDLGGTYLYPYSSDLYLGADLQYQYALAIPGVPYKDPTTMASNTTSFSIHDFDLRAVAGYDLHSPKGMVVFAHLGFRYQSFLVADVTDFAKNTAKLPSETFKAPVFGGALDIPKLTPTIGLNFHLDLAVLGTSVTQTKNLEDGASPSGKQFLLGATFSYRWKPEYNIIATYDLNYGSYSFGAPMATSMRDHTGTDVSRSDIFHSITVGLQRPF